MRTSSLHQHSPGLWHNPDHSFGSFSAGTDPRAGSQHMKAASSDFFRLPGMGVAGPTSAMTQADLGSDSAMIPGPVFRDRPSCPEMVVVPAGTFIMGSPESERGRMRAVYDEEGTEITWMSIDGIELPVEEGQRLVVVEGPQRYVMIEVPPAVGVYEVTFEEWDTCARSGGCGGVIPDNEGWGRGRWPVINVNWDEAQGYVRWWSQETGQEYSLLTEARGNTLRERGRRPRGIGVRLQRPNGHSGTGPMRWLWRRTRIGGRCNALTDMPRPRPGVPTSRTRLDCTICWETYGSGHRTEGGAE